MKITRRELLLAVASATGCILPSKPPPRIAHVSYPMGPIPRRRHGIARGLFVGASRIDITPPEDADVWLAGFGFQRKMERIRDPIFATCLYFDDGEQRVALVVADVVGLLLPTVHRVRRLVGNGIQLAVASTHNHQSPDTMGYWGEAILFAFPHTSGMDPAYMRVMERRLAVSVKEAAEQAKPARLFFGRGTIPDGVVRNLRNPGVRDGAIEVMEARSLDGRVLATHVNLACHAETLGERARLLTADFPGVLRRRIAGARGSTAVFSNGALGGMITPDLDRDAELSERIGFMEEMGERLAEAALAAVETAEPADVDRVRYLRTEVELFTDNTLYPTLERIGLVEPHVRGEKGGFLTEVGRIDLGPASWALIPGEPTPKVGLAIKEMLRQSGASHTAVIALGNDELGYILDPMEYDDPAFSYEVSVSVGRGTAPAITKALQELPPRGSLRGGRRPPGAARG